MLKQVLPENLDKALLTLLKMFETEDQYIRLQQSREFKKMNLFWHGFQYLFWSERDQDWRIPTHQQVQEISSREETRYIFDYVINIFKAHGESIIAALSADIPEVQFGPRDANDPDDHRAIEAADNCVELIEKWNRAKLQIINALFYLATEGFVAAYNYNRKDPAYGTTNIPQYGTRMEQTSPDRLMCDNCGYEEPIEEGPPTEPPMEDPTQEGSAENPAEEGADSTGVESPSEPPSNPVGSCPQCGAPMHLEPGQMEEVPFMSSERPVPKGREIVEIYGALNVRVPSYCAKQADFGCLLHYVDADPAVFKDTFPDVADKIEYDASQSYDRVLRQSSLSMEGYQMNMKLATQKRMWLRPWFFNRLGDDHEVEKKALRKKFPEGVYFSYINDILCEARAENMDDHWTVTKAGPSKGIHADPLLKSLVPIQELRNNLTNLFVMQVEYGVPATYADTEVFDFEGQSKQEVSPGYIYPVKPRPGQHISDAFYTEKTTVLNKESTELLQFLDQDAQFTTGDYPSIYGGPSQSGSKTLGEYDRSRSFALQRLSLTWYFLNVFWGEVMHKMVLSFIDHQIEDEPITSKSPNGWQTKWIKAADFHGSFDKLEPDPSADLPNSFAQKRSVLMNLFGMNKPEIDSVLLSPENAGAVQSYVGLRELVIPTNLQRNKQIRELLLLTQGMPSEAPPDPMNPMGGPQFLSSVPVEPEIDNHQVHIDILTDFLSSDSGQDLKSENMPAYANCMAHLLEHKKAMMPLPGAVAPGGSGGPGLQPPGPPGPLPKPNGAPSPGAIQ